jgi:hypothetical protein
VECGGKRRRRRSPPPRWKKPDHLQGRREEEGREGGRGEGEREGERERGRKVTAATLGEAWSSSLEKLETLPNELRIH